MINMHRFLATLPDGTLVRCTGFKSRKGSPMTSTQLDRWAVVYTCRMGKCMVVPTHQLTAIRQDGITVR